jgi:hypothetical protein
MRAYQALEDMVTKTAEQWRNAIYWGRGVDFPDEKRKPQEKKTTKRAAARR